MMEFLSNMHYSKQNLYESIISNVEQSLYEALDFDEIDDTNHSLNNSNNIVNDLYEETIKEKVNLIMNWSNDYSKMTLEQYNALIELSTQYGRPCIKVKDRTELLVIIVRRLYKELKLVHLNLNFIDTSETTDMNNLFYNCENLRTIDVGNWDTSKVTDMAFMFYNCTNLRTIDVGNWDTSKVTNMSNMFLKCSELRTIDVRNWVTSNVTYMYNMFNKCENLRTIDVGNWDTNKVTNMYAMFKNCTNLRTLDVSGWDISNVINMSDMFNGCENLRTDISMWRYKKGCIKENMLDGTKYIKSFY